MKRNLLIFFGVFAAVHLLAQPPQTNSISNGINFNSEEKSIQLLDSAQLFIINKDQESRTVGADDVKLIQEQSSFKKEVDTYKASKAKVKSNSSSRSASEAEEMQLQQSVENLKGVAQTLSEQIEANILYYDQGNYNAERAPQLMEALRLNPNHPQGLNLLLANSIVTGDTLLVLHTLNKLKSLHLIPDAMICYGNDLIQSVPDNTTLITHGTLDTYSAIQEQLVMHRNAIDIISLDLLQSDQYRALLLKKGFAIPVQSIVDVTYLGDLIRVNPSKTFAFSMTIPSDYLVQFEQDLAPNGLVFLYPNSLGNEQILQTNEQFMDSFSYMECGVELDESIAGLKQNYLPMILTVETLSSDKSKEKRSKIESRKIKIRQKK